MIKQLIYINFSDDQAVKIDEIMWKVGSEFNSRWEDASSNLATIKYFTSLVNNFCCNAIE